jgi:hypothetical protein
VDTHKKTGAAPLFEKGSGQGLRRRLQGKNKESPKRRQNDLIALEFGEVGLLGVDWCRFVFFLFFWQKNGADYEDEEALTRFLDIADVEEISDTDGAVASVIFVCLWLCRCLVN